MARESDLTRRGLLRGLGTTVLVAPACKADGPEPDATTPPGSPTPLPARERVPLRFTLDGEPTEASVEARTTLLDLLRLELGKTGTKRSCDRGACGACMVLIDGAAHNACMTLALDVEGRNVETVEGLAEGETLTPLQAAFVQRDAAQCGFCTAGMLISCTALLRSDPAPTPDRIRRGIAGNYCRCGTYPHVVAAVLDVADADAGRDDERDRGGDPA